MIVGSSLIVNNNCSLHRVYVIEFCYFGPKVKNSQDFDNIVLVKMAERGRFGEVKGDYVDPFFWDDDGR